MRKFIVLLVTVCMICLFPVAQGARSATSPARVSASNAVTLAEPQGPYQDSGSYEPYTGEQLDNLLAPIALYPDPLLAQVLLATTFPDQIDDAAHYINDNGPNDIDYQNWDVSVKAVAHYPSVLSMLDTMLDWTTALGQAYVYQSTDVMTSVQRLRGLAYSEGNLVSTPQQQVIVNGGYIQIDPAQPQVIYVPVYDPGVIYERRVYSPGVGFGGFFNFGSGFAIGAWLNYDLDWGSHRVIYDGWGGGDTGWRQRSRPYVKISNAYVNNRYATVNVNRTVVNRHVDYNNVNRFNSVHHDVNYDNRARTQPNRGNNQVGQPRGGFQPRQQNNGSQPGNGRQGGDQRSFNPGDRNQPPAAATQPNGGGRATDRGVRNQPPPATPEQPARNTQQPPQQQQQQQQQPNQRPFAYGSRNQREGPQGDQQNQNRRVVPNQQQQPRQTQPTVGAPPQQNNRSFNPGAPNNNQPPAARPQPPARPTPPTPPPAAAPAPAAQPAQHTPAHNAPANNESRGQGQGQGQRGGGHDGGGKNNDKNDGKK